MSEQIKCYILISTEVGREYEVASSIRRNFGDKIDEVVITYGLYDIVVRLISPNLRLIDEVVTGIRALPGVKETVTLIGA
ncbi:MAG: Lrp/AsnC family transcriptional regulator [Desulfurococcales archaeon]|nr:Lrp/AsnC family transcriptional regulator [Desulfurococcales archaeon]